MKSPVLRHRGFSHICGPSGGSGPHHHLEHAILLGLEKPVGLHHVRQRIGVGDQRLRIQLPGRDQTQDLPTAAGVHAAGLEGQILAVHLGQRQALALFVHSSHHHDAAGPGRLPRCLEGIRAARSLNDHVRAASPGQRPDPFQGLLPRLQGQVRIRVETTFPERVLNLCGARNLAFWDMEWESETAFTCRLNRRDYYALRRAVKQLDCRLTVVRKEGVPFFLGRFRRRHALLAGLTLCSALLFFGSFFIWDFTVEGNQRVTDEEILRALQRQGVGIGTFGISLDTEDIRNHVLLEIPELLWITVNVSGCRAYVEVRERVEAPEPVDEREPTNVVARRDGLILDIQAMDGVRCVLPGTSVEAGELLISGVEDTETVGARVLTGMGKAEARTWYTLSTVMPLTVAEKQYTGEEKQGYSLVFGTNRVKFFLNSSIGTGNYDKITERTQWSLFGLPLPVTFVKETFRFYETVPAEVSAAQAESRGEAILTDYLHTLVDPYGTVSSTLCTSRREGDGLLVTLTAECVEEIGRAVPIYTDPTEESGG